MIKKLLHPILLILVYLSTLAFALIILSGCEDQKITRPIPTPVTKMDGAVPVWSPDGQWIAIGWYGDYTAVPSGIYLIHPDGSNLHYFFGFNEYSSILDLCWSPDGEWLAFASGPPYAGCDIYKIKITGDSLTRLTTTGENYDCDWASSDTLIAFDCSYGDSSGIWLMNNRGEFKRLFIRYGAYFDFSSGDSLIYIISTGHDSAMMGIIAISDSKTRSILRWKVRVPYTIYANPSFSAIAAEISLEIDQQIWLIGIDGSNLRKLTENGGCRPDWSPDGKYIVYNEPGGDPMGGTIWIMNEDGSGKRLLVDWKDTISPTEVPQGISSFRPESEI